METERTVVFVCVCFIVCYFIHVYDIFWFVCFDVWLPKRKEEEIYWQEEKRNGLQRYGKQLSILYLDRLESKR